MRPRRGRKSDPWLPAPAGTRISMPWRRPSPEPRAAPPPRSIRFVPTRDGAGWPAQNSHGNSHPDESTARDTDQDHACGPGSRRNSRACAAPAIPRHRRRADARGLRVVQYPLARHAQSQSAAAPRWPARPGRNRGIPRQHPSRPPTSERPWPPLPRGATWCRRITAWNTAGRPTGHRWVPRPGGSKNALGESAIAVESDDGRLAKHLEASGARLRPDEPKVTVLVAEDYLEARLAEVNRRQLAAGATWVLARPLGIEALFGPVFRPEGPCWDLPGLPLAQPRGSTRVPAQHRRRGGRLQTVRRRALGA